MRDKVDKVDKVNKVKKVKREKRRRKTREKAKKKGWALCPALFFKLLRKYFYQGRTILRNQLVKYFDTKILTSNYVYFVKIIYWSSGIIRCKLGMLGDIYIHD